MLLQGWSAVMRKAAQAWMARPKTGRPWPLHQGWWSLVQIGLPLGSMKPAIDDRDWPVVRVTYDGPFTDDELRDYLAAMERFVARGERWGILSDGRLAARPTALQRQMITEKAKNPDPNMVALAMVTDSAVVRGAMRAMMWVMRPKYQVHTCDSLSAASRWLHRVIADRGATGRSAE